MKSALGLGLVLLAFAFAVPGSEPVLPSQVDLRPEFARYSLIPKAQGGRDVCSLCAITGLVEFEWGFAGNPARFSEEFLIWAASATTGKSHEQAMFYEAIRGLCAAGICAESLMPYQAAADPSRRPSKEALADAQARTGWEVLWIKGWDTKTGLSADQLAEVKRQLASGHPVAMGARWPAREQLTEGATLPTPPESGVFDGHSILFVGYQDDPSQPGGGRLLFRNHRGQNWADHGHAWMTYRYASLYVNDAVGLRARPSGPSPVRLKAENLKVVASSGCQLAPQDMGPWGAKLWRNGRQLFCRAENGGQLELELPVAENGRFRVELEATFAPDYGKLQVSLDGKPLKPAFDFYSGRVSPSGPMELGVVDLEHGAHRVTFTVTGKNEGSDGWSFGLDSIVLTAEPPKSAAPAHGS